MEKEKYIKTEEGIQIEALKQKRQWIVWKYKKDSKGNKTKVPYSYIGGVTGTNTKYQHTWVDFGAANNSFENSNFDGVGLIFTNSICGIDIDHKDLNDPMVQEILHLMDTYTELSPSTQGLHLLFKCDIRKIPKELINNELKLSSKYYSKNPNNNIECYFCGLTSRYFTFTENVVNKKPVAERTEQILFFLDRFMLKKNIDANKKSTNFLIVSNNQKNNNKNFYTNIDILEIARNSKNGIKFSNLFDKGDISGYRSESEADQALCNYLAFYTSGNFTQIDQYFCESKLYRDKWKRNEYKMNTINKAIDGCSGKFYEPKKNFNNHTSFTVCANTSTEINDNSAKIDEITSKSEKKNKKLVLKLGTLEFEHLSIEALNAYLVDKKISIKYNIMNRTIEIDGVNKKHNQETLTNDLPVILFNELEGKISGCNVERIANFLAVIAGINRYNPVLEMLRKYKWDKRDRIYELYEILSISDTDSLSRVLIFKWLCQAISMAKNDIKNPYGADGILVLQGKQGIGKTTFVRKIAVTPKFCKLGQHIDTKDKDTYRRCCSAWIIELGEIETTFKSDLERLKSFITSEIDEYRLPYGRCDQILARRSVMVGTCNSDRFLIDPTGSRRFWTVPIEKIDLKRLEKFNSLQLWLQIEEEFGKNRQGFRLTTQERELLEQRNSKHEKLLRGQAEVEDVLSKTNPSLVYRDVTVSQFKECHSEFKSCSVDQISKALTRLGVEQKIQNIVVNGKRTTKKVRSLPVWKDSPE